MWKAVKCPDLELLASILANLVHPDVRPVWDTPAPSGSAHHGFSERVLSLLSPVIFVSTAG